MHKILCNIENIGSSGVVAASAGNHAQGVALAASEAGLPATIIMPEWASITKQEATRGYGGKVIIHGRNITECLQKAKETAGKGKMLIHPYNDPEIIAGQGTVALEVLEEMGDADMIIVPIGGGGLISGTATVIKAINPQVGVIGVQAANSSSAYESFRRNEVTAMDTGPSIADGINVKQVGDITFDIIRELVDDVVLVDEEHIISAILMLLETKKILAEGAGAVGLAALLNGRIHIAAGAKVVLLISGGNLDSPVLDRIIRSGLSKRGRIMRFRVQLEDLPGSLAKLLALIADLKANVLHIHHGRYTKDLPIYSTQVDLDLETRSHAHVAEITTALDKAGYNVGIN